jgi:hypothetical protein
VSDDPPVRRLGVAGVAAIVAGVIVACGGPVTGSPIPARRGFVDVELEIAPGTEEYFASQHRGRIVAADGSVLADWEITDGATPIEVPAGRAQLQGFTVFLGDFLECSGDPSGSGGRCAQPTLAPSHVCAIPIEIVAGGTVSARFRSLPEARCELTGLPAGSG